jgi:hypothetical protein
MKTTICVVFVCNKAYFYHFIKTCSQLITNGNYKGPICLIIGNDLINDTLIHHDIIIKNNIIVKYFPDIPFDNSFLYQQYYMNRPSHWFPKMFQYHKFHIFTTYFKQWDYILYLDCGMTIFSDIYPILNERKENILKAHSDAYPEYKNKLNFQFDSTNKEYYTKLSSTYNLNNDYFQTTMLLFDTKIIEYTTYNNLYNLLMEYPISISNDQGIIALYFTVVKPCFEQIKLYDNTTYFYDFLSRDSKNKYIMLKRE